MPDLTRSGSALIQPTNPYSLADLELAKFIINNGTAGVASVASPTIPALGTIQNAVSATAIGGTINTAGYTSVALQVLGTFVGTVAFEASLDNTNWVPYNMVQDNGNVVGTTATTTGLFRASAAGLLGVRARVSAYTSGTISILSRPAMEVLHPIVVNADLPQALSASIDSITNLPTGWTYTNIAGTAGTVVIKNAAGTIGGYIINTPVASDAITFYDNASGTSALTIGKVILPATLLMEGPDPVNLPLAFLNGLVVGHGGTSDITIAWK